MEQQYVDFWLERPKTPTLHVNIGLALLCMAEQRTDDILPDAMWCIQMCPAPSYFFFFVNFPCNVKSKVMIQQDFIQHFPTCGTFTHFPERGTLENGVYQIIQKRKEKKTVYIKFG